MPKLKSHSGAKKRFNLTKTGKVKRAHAFKSHILNKKSTKRKNESSATVAEAAHALGVEPASIAKTLSDGLFCDSQSNADNIDSVLQT